MKPRDIRVYLFDAARACDRIMQFVDGSTLEGYVENDLLRSAVERQLIILGEALGRAAGIDQTLDQHISDLAQIVAFRNRLVHNYQAIEPRLVWAIIQNGVPAVRANLGRI